MEPRLSKFSVSELIDLAAGIAALIKTAFPDAGESKPRFSSFDMCNIPVVIAFQIEILQEIPFHLPEECITDYKASYPPNSTFPSENENEST